MACLHSLRLRSRGTGQPDETDFVIADPSRPSLLIVEVKGGLIEVTDGQWCQNGHLMDSSPLNQAFAFRSLLVERFRDLKVNPPPNRLRCMLSGCFVRERPF